MISTLGGASTTILARMAPIAFAAVLGLGLATQQALASPHNTGGGGGGGRGGGVGISIDIGGVIDAVRRAQEAEKAKQKPQPTRTSCPRNMVWSSRSRSCVCARGFVPHGDGCQRPPQVTQPRPQPQPQPQPPARQPDVDVVLVQECLNKVGYDVGAADGVAGRGTIAGWRAFQRDNSLRQTNTVTDPRTVALLMDKCEDEPQVASLPEPPAPAPAPIPVAVRSASPLAPAEAPARCLPQDLHDLLARAYGRRPDVAVCPAACLPKPVGYTQARLAAVSRAQGIQWCEDCITLGAWLPLTTILAIERAASITLCASPTACYVPIRPEAATRTEVRTIFRSLPRSIGKEGDIAVIVGNESYAAEEIPDNPKGAADAIAVRTLLVEQLGFRDRNIVDLRDAKLADLERVFGDEDAAESELAKRLGADKRANVFVYVSSYGLAREETGTAHLLPVDADLDSLDTSAYPMQRLYDNLGRLGARSTMVVLEADFARDVGELIDPPNLPEIDVAVMPETPIPGLAVFKASDRDQRTLVDPEYGMGLFTRYLIEGLAGKADEAPIGNGDGRIDAVELFVYTSDMVRTAARKSFGVEQKPLLSEIGNILVGQLAR